MLHDLSFSVTVSACGVGACQTTTPLVTPPRRPYPHHPVIIPSRQTHGCFTLFAEHACFFHVRRKKINHRWDLRGPAEAADGSGNMVAEVTLITRTTTPVLLTTSPLTPI